MSLGSTATRVIARFFAARDLAIVVEGVEHLPASGPVLLAARHYHHFYDGAALLDGLPRTPRIFVALDWATSPRVRRWMERLCAWADWPVALRGDALRENARSAYDPHDVARYVRRSLAHGARILREGGTLVVFPEGYPTIDPAGRRKPSDDAFLPFAAGFLSIVALAQRSAGATFRIPIVPVGLTYELAQRPRRTAVTIRLGSPRTFDPSRDDRAAFIAELEDAVRVLSAGVHSGVTAPRDLTPSLS